MITGPVGVPMGVEVGLYGKLPSHGDFLRRRLPDGFIAIWDVWLQECIAASRTALGERWLDVYLTSPAWRFACAGGVLGLAPVVGLMVPSVDRVGRYFHLTLAARLPDDCNIVSAATALDGFFDRAERLAIDTLAAEHIDFETFDQQVSDLSDALTVGLRASRTILDPSGGDSLSDTAAARSWHVPLGSRRGLIGMCEQLVAQRLSQVYAPLVLWWTDGSAIVEPSCLMTSGLPRPETFAALLDGAWVEHQWQSIPAVPEPGPMEAEVLLADDPAPPRFRSAGVTDVGKVRAVNQDAFLERPEIGLWAVADGLGGLSDGEIASRMVCDALADFVPDASFEQMVEAASERLSQVNEHLVRASMRQQNPVKSGSTVVTLLTRGTRCAVLWAGDSRVYRAREGQFEQLTRDHSVAEQSGGAGEEGHSTAITQAVGGDPTLALDLYRDRVRPGDRFLLCSDGLTRAVAADRIHEWMAHMDIRVAVDGLLQATLDAGAPDNVTVVIVEAFA